MTYIKQIDRETEQDRAAKIQINQFLDTLQEDAKAENRYVKDIPRKNEAQRELVREIIYDNFPGTRERTVSVLQSDVQDKWDYLHALQQEVSDLKLEDPNCPIPPTHPSIQSLRERLEKLNTAVQKIIGDMQAREDFLALVDGYIVFLLSEADRDMGLAITAALDVKTLQANDHTCWMLVIEKFGFSDPKSILEALKKRCPAYVNQKNPDGDTPLHYAAKKGDIDVMLLLYRIHGADSAALDAKGYTAFQLLEKLHPAKYTLLKQHVSESVIQPKEPTSTLFDLYASQSELHKTYLTQAGADVICIRIQHIPQEVYLSIPLDGSHDKETAIHAAKNRMHVYETYLEIYREFCEAVDIPFEQNTFPVISQDLKEQEHHTFYILPRGCCIFSAVDQHPYMQHAMQKRKLIQESVDPFLPNTLSPFVQSYAEEYNPFSREEIFYLRTIENVVPLQAIHHYFTKTPKGPGKCEKLETLLLWAIKKKHFLIVEMLLKEGVNANTKDERGASALDYAYNLEESDIGTLLASYGAERNLFSAGFSEILLEREDKALKSLSVIQKDERGAVALHYVSNLEEINIGTLLASYGAKSNLLSADFSEILLEREDKALKSLLVIQLKKMRAVHRTSADVIAAMSALIVKIENAHFSASEKMHMRISIEQEREKLYLQRKSAIYALDALEWHTDYCVPWTESPAETKERLRIIRADMREGKKAMEEMQCTLQKGKGIFRHMESSLKSNMETARFPVLPEERNRFLAPVVAKSVTEEENKADFQKEKEEGWREETTTIGPNKTS